MLEGLLHTKQERLVVQHVLIEESKLRQLYAQHPDCFQDIDEINTIHERVKARLPRNLTLRHYLCDSIH